MREDETKWLKSEFKFTENPKNEEKKIIAKITILTIGSLRTYPELVLSDNPSQFQMVFKTIMEKNIKLIILKKKWDDLAEYNAQSPLMCRSV